AIDRVLRYAIRARYLSHCFAAPHFIQNADDLFFAVAFALPLLAHENVPAVALLSLNTLTPPASIVWCADRARTHAALAFSLDRNAPDSTSAKKKCPQINHPGAKLYTAKLTLC